jgi:GntR family transcriptional regulator/MocR family aminotransferase
LRRQPATNLLIPLDSQPRGRLQRQVCSGIRRAILEGVVSPGMRLPSSRALAAELDVSRTTTILVLEQLVAEGYLTARVGAGTFVAEELPDDLPRLAPARRVAGRSRSRLSRRGAAVAAAPQGAERLAGPPGAFRVGTPGVDLFPVRLWSRLAGRCLRSATGSDLDYGDPAGLPALRMAIANHVSASRGARCEADQVLVVAGAQQGLDLVCRMLLDPGDRAWLEDPGYPGARSALVAAGARIVPVRVDAEGLELASARRLGRAARLVYVTPSHQYPLGVPMSLPRRLALLKWASSARAWIVEDDYDSEFRYGTRSIPCLHGLDEDGRVIYLGSFSKTLFPALRLGFLIAPADLCAQLAKARGAADQHPPALDQATLAAFIGEGHFARHLSRMRTAYRERLETLVAAAARLCGDVLRVRETRTGLHVVADLEGVDARRVSAEAARRGVEATPLAVYFARPSQAPNALLLGFAAVGPRALVRGMEVLAAAIESARRGAERVASIPGPG